MNRMSETPFERRERLDLENALLLSTQAEKSSLARLPSLHGTLDNSSYPGTGTGTGTGTTDEIASFGQLAPPPGLNAPTPQSEIESFGSGRGMSSKGKVVEQAAKVEPAGGAEDDDEVIGDSEGEEREPLRDPRAHHNNTGASRSSNGPSTSSLARAPVATPVYDWSEPSTISSLATAPAAVTVAVAVAVAAQPPTTKKPRESPFAIVVPSATKVPIAKPSSKSPAVLSNEFVDSDDDDSAPPAKKRPAAAVADEHEQTDYDELPSFKPLKKKARRALSAAAPSSDPLAAFDGRQSRSRSRSRSLSLLEGPAPPAAKTKGKEAKFAKTAISSDGEGTAELLRHVQEREAREAEDDDDFGAPAKKKQKAARKKKEIKEKKEPKPRKPTKAQLKELERVRRNQDAAMPAGPLPSLELAAGPAVPPVEPALKYPAPAVQPELSAPSSQPNTTAASRNKKRGVVNDSDDEAPAAAPLLPVLAAADDADDEEDVSAPVPAKKAPKRVNKGKGKATAVDSSASESESEEVPQPRKADVKDKAEVARRIEAVMAAAIADEDALGLASGSGTGPGSGGRKSNEENVAPRSTAGTPVVSGFAKARVAIRSGSAPSPSAKKGLAGVMEKKALWGHRAPGMSSRVKVPRLHTNLKPPPPPKPPVPKEKARVKKGHEEYSDEDKPWYETKHPEEWDSDDREKFAKVQKRREKGWDSN